jgi:hypothetical protein
MISTQELFRRLYGDELADQVEQLKKRPTRIVWKPAQPPPKQAEPEQKPLPKVSDVPNWWDR